MSSIPQKTDDSNSPAKGNISRFIRKFRIGTLLGKCNAVKQAGISVLTIFTYLLSIVFKGRSMYADLRLNPDSEMSKNTIYRFLNDPTINWERFGISLAAAAIQSVEPLTAEDRVNAFVVDDTPYHRDRSKKSELLSRIWDHSDRKYPNGYRDLFLGWTDGNTFIPVTQTLLASGQEKNVLEPAKTFDGRTLAARRRKRAQTKSTEVTLQMIANARKAGIHCNMVLFDSWFWSAKMGVKLRDMGMHCIAMAKKNKNFLYIVNEDGKEVKRTVTEIFKQNRKRPGRSRYLLKVDAEVEHDGKRIPVSLVFVRNRNNRKDWLVLVSTDPSLEPEEIIRIYGKRWSIECFFKFCKQYLKLTDECHGISYDALNAHITIVMARYVMLALEQRCSTDWRSLGDLFLYGMDELKDITYLEAFQKLFAITLECAITNDDARKNELDKLLDDFTQTLPMCLKLALKIPDKQCAS